MQSTRSWRTGAAVAVLLLLAACDSSAAGTRAEAPRPAATAARIISVATLKPGQTVPAPAGKALFTMTGKISATNKGANLVFDQQTLEGLGLVQVKLYEPWTK